MKHYFAYGTLLSTKAMQDFAPSAQPVGVMRLDGFELGFAETKKPGTGGCWLQPTPGGTVYGVQFEVSDEDLARMDAASGVPEGLWVHCPITVRDEHDNSVETMTYTIPGSPGPFRPSKDYVGKIKLGLATVKLPADYVTRVDSRLDAIV
ncbi:gamma-glutamylcyclotransferase family protein [Sedimentitalea todarodis]|uniref:Gamma-glutamylcyclotransferase family protein n=1 Tax=Sedimentitalea todarodis TaxID=1631240 RepID=A0ABU3VDY5_9RHOB|nr:gamma-glutamylcyclotransferase family protein [Sedimentitalea todarodis]MDU9004392.1 gamma-glutamylcyclotransferase family protein [Sedimentitalea todarodis]